MSGQALTIEEYREVLLRKYGIVASHPQRRMSEARRRLLVRFDIPVSFMWEGGPPKHKRWFIPGETLSSEKAVKALTAISEGGTA